MPIDNRKVLQNIRIPVTEQNPSRRTLTAENADEITEMFSQEQLDRFVKSGALAGDWKTSRASAKTATETKTDAKGK